MAENNTKERGGLGFKIIGGIVVVVIVALLIIFGGSKERAQEAADENTETEQPDTALHVIKPVVSGDYEYVFSGIKWIFDTDSQEVSGTGQTWVKMEFADFTRNGNAIAFGRPYKLGFHPGTCEESDYIDTSEETGIPFSYATCEGEGVRHDFVVLQESEKVVVKMKETKGEEIGVWKEWYKIDVTEIVR